MLITELLPEQNITLQVYINATILSFESRVIKCYPRKASILTTAVFKENKPISFHGAGIIVNVIVAFPDAKPILFKNVTSKLMKNTNGEYCYLLTTITAGSVYNRRENFRCFLGIPIHVQFGLNTVARPAVIRDISYTGFAIVCDSSISMQQGQIIHTVLTDQPKKNGNIYSFHLYGIIVRIQELENGNRLFGCVINQPVVGLDKYIMEKERLRLHSTNGGKLFSPK